MTDADSITILSDPKNLKIVRDFIRKAAADCGFPEKERHDIVLAVDEACANIMRHAYGGRKNGKIVVTMASSPLAFRVTLQDFGIKPDLVRLQSSPQQKLRCGGYGVVFIKHGMDDVNYDTSPECGTVLRLVKYKNTL